MLYVFYDFYISFKTDSEEIFEFYSKVNTNLLYHNLKPLTKFELITRLNQTYKPSYIDYTQPYLSNTTYLIEFNQAIEELQLSIMSLLHTIQKDSLLTIYIFRLLDTNFIKTNKLIYANMQDDYTLNIHFHSFEIIRDNLREIVEYLYQTYRIEILYNPANHKMAEEI